MAVTAVKLFRGALGTASATLYTVPPDTTTIVKQITITNTTAGAITATVALGGTNILSGTSIAANSVAVIDLSQPMNAAETITGLGSAAGLNAHIGGVEVT